MPFVGTESGRRGERDRGRGSRRGSPTLTRRSGEVGVRGKAEVTERRKTMRCQWWRGGGDARGDGGDGADEIGR